MSWNYRIMERRDKDGNHWFGIHEVYYTGHHTDGWTADAVAAQGDTAEEVVSSLTLMLEAQDRTILKEWELPGYDGP